jgi:hypothetical protein
MGEKNRLIGILKMGTSVVLEMVELPHTVKTGEYAVIFEGKKMHSVYSIEAAKALADSLCGEKIDEWIAIDDIVRERDEAREGYRALNKNWDAVHSSAMTPIRSAVGKEDATVPEIVGFIEEHKVLKKCVEHLLNAAEHAVKHNAKTASMTNLARACREAKEEIGVKP